ncbi:MAG: hypothetical protein QG573_1112 [Acidobacteriota bacterium]|nr:hypothetical protein [Acidobacteriota bacterium]
MNRSRILIAVGMTVAVALFTGTLASGTEKVGKQEGLSCTVCHDKPGSKLLTDQGKYYETMRTLAGFEELKATFGACTSCHVTKPGSKKLTAKGKEFQDLVKDMEGLGAWMKEHHPKAPASDAGAAAPVEPKE